MKSHRFADIFPMIEGQELENLKEDIKEHGLLNPIITYEGEILDGRNRFRACSEIGVEPKIEEYKGTKPLEFVISLNLKRRHLTKDQIASLSPTIIEFEQEESMKRQKDPFNSIRNGGVVPKEEQGRTIEKVAKQLEIGKNKIHQIKKLMEEGRNDLIEDVKFKRKTLTDIKKEQRLEKIKQQREELQKEVLEQPTGLFDVIVIDPPWKYDGDIFKETKDGLPAYQEQGMRGTTPYPTMSLEEIKNINFPIKEDCVLWLWTTNSFLLKTQELLDIWGFELKSILTWNKEIMGTGRWLRSQTEHCILAIKGKPFFNNTKWTTLISEKRTTHSTKPEIFYKMVDEICAGRKLDYFARKKREGWDVYGDEVK